MISRHFSDVLLQNPLAVQQALRQCTGVDGTYNMCSVVDHLVGLSAIRNSLQQVSCHGMYAIKTINVNLYSAITILQTESPG